MKKLLMMLAISLVMVACKKDETEIDPKKLSVEDSYYEIDPAELVGTCWSPSSESRIEIFDNNEKLVTVISGEWISNTSTSVVMKFEEDEIRALEYRLQGRYAGELTVNYDINGNTIRFFSDKFDAQYAMFTKDVMVRCVDSQIVEKPYTTRDGVKIKVGYTKKSYFLIKKSSDDEMEKTLDLLYRNSIEVTEDNDGHIHL